MIVLWWIGLVVTLVVFVPLASYLLHTTWRAARSIQLYARESLQAARAIAANTQNIAALDTTISVAPQLVAAASDVDGKLATMATALSQRAGA